MIGLALLGAGRMAKVHAEAISAAGARLVTVFDVAEAAAASLAAKSGGLFRDMMIHDFDMARWMLGEEPTSVHSRGSCLVDSEIGKLGDIDTACVTLVTPSGKQAVILNSRRSAFGFDQRIEAFGSAGMVMSDNPRATGFQRFSSRSFGAPDRFRAFFMERYGTVIAWKLRRFSMDWLKANRHQ